MRAERFDGDAALGLDRLQVGQCPAAAGSGEGLADLLGLAVGPAVFDRPAVQPVQNDRDDGPGDLVLGIAGIAKHPTLQGLLDASQQHASRLSRSLV